MGCYPLFTCQDWLQLHADLDEMGDALVSLVLVADPFGDYQLSHLRECFRDVVLPFKEHFVVDLSRRAGTLVSNHHRRCARRALRRVEVVKCEDPNHFLREWVDLYSAFVAKRGIKGPAAFSPSSLAQQLTVPGLSMFRALHRGATVGMHLWFTHDTVGYAHLAAYTDIGYKLGASYALFWSVIEYFTVNGLGWLVLGAGAGIKDDDGNGLTEFKRGWSTGTRTAYLCGRICHRERYSEMVQAKNVAATGFFPAYRAGEMG